MLPLAIKRVKLAALAAGLMASTVTALREGSWTFTFAQDGGSEGLRLAGPGTVPQIRVSPEDFPGVIRAANDLAADFGKVLGGANPTVVKANWRTTTSSAPSTGPIIIVGTVGRSTLIDGLAAAGQLNTSGMAGEWEMFSHQVVPSSPWQGRTEGVFVIAGSDLRGTSFGVYDVSEQIGVSPWHYWIDAPPISRQHIWAHGPSYVSPSPSVKYRGIFLNDEDPALTGWGRANFRTSQYGSAFVSDFYRRIFDLLVRLKANYLWPAMWSSMFYLDDPQNGVLANEYGVFMGTSHHEPMARADKEQGRFLRGNWDWRSNKNNVKAFMQAGPERAKAWNHTIYTVGMRGSGDAASPTLTSPQLEEIIAWQESTLTQTLGKSASEIPHAWMMYKEVPGYWQNGMRISEHVTLVWSDDNRGNIRRVPLANENTRAGGSGMYYHFDYVGSPRNYKWINTIQLQKTWEQMKLSYDRGIDRIWIANVGDLKALELPAAHFLAMAYDITKFSSPHSTASWLTSWCRQQFGASVAEEAASIMTVYGKLTARRKYEDLSNNPFAFEATNYDEAELNLGQWSELVRRAQAVYDKLPANAQSSFFEVVLHPVIAGKQVFEIYTKVAIGNKFSAQHRMSTNQLTKEANDAFAADQALQRRWDALLRGKWRHFMDQTHIGYDNWQQPARNRMPRTPSVTGAAYPVGSILGVGIQGSTAFYPAAATLNLEPVNPYLPPGQQRWLEVFAREAGSCSYRITSNVAYVNVTNPTGTVTARASTATDIRSLISVDWSAAPAGRSVASLTVVNTSSGTARAVVYLTLDKPASPPPSDFKGHIETSGVVSMEAGHGISTPADAYITLPDYGRTHSGVKLKQNASPSQTAPNGPYMSFSFYTFPSSSTTSNAGLRIYLGSTMNSDPSNPGRFAYSLDGTAPRTVQVVNNYAAGGDPPGWTQAVTENTWIRNVKIGNVAPGKHVLRFWLLEPTLVLTKLVVDLGGMKSSTLGPPESLMIGS